MRGRMGREEGESSRHKREDYRPSVLSVREGLVPGPHDTNIFRCSISYSGPPSTDAGLADMESPLCNKVCLSWESLKTEREGK